MFVFFSTEAFLRVVRGSGSSFGRVEVFGCRKVTLVLIMSYRVSLIIDFFWSEVKVFTRAASG